MTPPLRPPRRRKGPPSWRNERRAEENQNTHQTIDLSLYVNVYRDYWRWVGEQIDTVNAGGQVNLAPLRSITDLQRAFHREFGLNLLNDTVQAEVIGAILRDDLDELRKVSRALRERANGRQAEGHGNA